MKLIRSFLFVPGNRESWLDKVAGADALVLPAHRSAEGRHRRGAGRAPLFARV